MQHALSRLSARLWRRLAIGLALLCLLSAGAVALLRSNGVAHAASTITVNGGVTHQVIDGFGASDAFGTGQLILNQSNASTILNDLFNPSTGAGLTIVRNEIGASTNGSSGDSQPSIEPNAPSGPNATPTYVFTNDGGQLTFSQQAKSIGATQFYADAWSAPQYMKTNGSLLNGGYVCGMPSPAPSCSSGDWRQAYANYLAQYAKFYSQAGLPLSYVDFVNEPNFTPNGYVGMLLDSTSAGAGNKGSVNSGTPQAVDFIKNYLGPALAASGTGTKVACCDAPAFPDAATYASGILAGASSSVGLITGHAYYASPNGLITNTIPTNGQHVWETEAATFDSFDTAWDDGSDASGFQWAGNLWSALTQANVNAYLYWWFAENNSSNSDNEAFFNINGSNVTLSTRLWAFGQYSRFIRPGATRIDATTSDGNLKVSAFANTDGSQAVVVLNGNNSATSLTVSGVSGSTATPFLTNASNSIAQQSAIGVSGGSFSATIPARSLVTYRVSGSGSSTPTATPTIGGSTPTATATRTSTPTPTPTVVGNTPTPTPTTTSGNNGVTATGVVAQSSPWFSEEDLKFSGASTITAMTATITVQKTAGVVYNGSYVTFGGATLGHTDNGSTITYTFTLNSGQTLPSGQSLLDAAQFGGNGTVHPTSGDLWSITTTSNGVTSTQSGHF